MFSCDFFSKPIAIQFSVEGVKNIFSLSAGAVAKEHAKIELQNGTKQAGLAGVWKEKQLKINREEKIKIQSKVTRMSKALKDSYTYIGEINRKIDIMKNIALGFPEVKDAKSLKGRNIYNSIEEAIKILCKTNNFLIRVVNVRNNETELEIPNGLNMGIKIKNNSLGLMKDKDFLQNDDFFIFRSPQLIDGKRSYVFIKRSRTNQIEDIDIMHTITTQILFLFILLKKLKLKY